MNCERKSLRLYAVTDRSWLGGTTLAEQVEEALKGGVTCVQLREKELDTDRFLEQAREILALCRRYKVPLLINDRVDIAKEIGADGVHVGQSDMEVSRAREILGDKAIIGVSARTVEQALEAERNGADYLGVGAVFGTNTKQDARPIPHETLREICRAVSIPVVAIGGITRDNLPGLRGCGLDGVALVSAIFAAGDIAGECRSLRKLCEELFVGGEREAEKVSRGKKMKTALSIAGSDCSGGAGIQADLKTMTMNGVYAMSAITALTAQNTMGVLGISEVTPAFLGLQLDAVFTDIYPDAIKIGMVSSTDLIEVIAEKLRAYRAGNIVVDPVMVATSGARLISEEAIGALTGKLLPLADLVTPNIPEAELLSGRKIGTPGEMEEAAAIISEKYHCAVLCKGGHCINDANDLLYVNGKVRWFPGRRIDNPNTHGTGCTLSSAIAANLAKNGEILGDDASREERLADAISKAKEYISGALEDMLDLGSGSGPMNHGYLIKKTN